MPRVTLKYRNISHGSMKSIYLEFNPSIRDVKGKPVRYECLNLEIYTHPETVQQAEQNKTIEEIAETIRCKRYLQLVHRDYSFLAKPNWMRISWSISGRTVTAMVRNTKAAGCIS